jgi:hypothetical protein
MEIPLMQGFREHPDIQEVTCIDTNAVHESISFFDRIERRMNPNSNRRIKAYNKQLLQALESLPSGTPLLVFKGMEVLPSTLVEAKKRGCILVNFNPDHPYIFSGRGSGNRNVTEGIPLYDLYLTYSHDAKTKLMANGVRSEVVPFGFENSEWMDDWVTAEEEILATCFVGNPDRDRIDFLKAVAQHVPLHVYGLGWDQTGLPKEVVIHSAVRGDDFFKTLRAYRVQWNLMRPHNPESHNMRSFDVPGCGGIGLMPRNMDHQNFLQEGAEVYLYADLNEAVIEANKLLALDYETALSVRKAARNRLLTNKATYKDRANQMVEHIQSLIG